MREQREQREQRKQREIAGREENETKVIRESKGSMERRAKGEE